MVGLAVGVITACDEVEGLVLGATIGLLEKEVLGDAVGRIVGSAVESTAGVENFNTRGLMS